MISKSLAVTFPFNYNLMNRNLKCRLIVCTIRSVSSTDFLGESRWKLGASIVGLCDLSLLVLVSYQVFFDWSVFQQIVYFVHFSGPNNEICWQLPTQIPDGIAPMTWILEARSLVAFIKRKHAYHSVYLSDELLSGTAWGCGNGRSWDRIDWLLVKDVLWQACSIWSSQIFRSRDMQMRIQFV